MRQLRSGMITLFWELHTYVAAGRGAGKSQGGIGQAVKLPKPSFFRFMVVRHDLLGYKSSGRKAPPATVSVACKL